MTQSKTCGRCRETKPVADFAPSRQTRDGLFGYCRPCKRLSDSETYARNKDRWKPNRQAYYRANRDAFIARAKAAYLADREAGKRRAREWAEANPERRTEIRQASFKKRYAEDPEPKREAWRRRHAKVRRGCVVYSITREQLAAKVAYWGHKCWMCGGPYDAMDHVKPLNKGGAHCLANLRPACTPCNTRKRDRWPYAPAA